MIKNSSNNQFELTNHQLIVVFVVQHIPKLLQELFQISSKKNFCCTHEIFNKRSKGSKIEGLKKTFEVYEQEKSVNMTVCSTEICLIELDFVFTLIVHIKYI